MRVATRQYRNLEPSDCVSMILRINDNTSLRLQSGFDAISRKIMAVVSSNQESNKQIPYLSYLPPLPYPLPDLRYLGLAGVAKLPKVPW